MPTCTERTPIRRTEPILVVDDDPAIRRVMQMAIRHAGHQTDLAADVAEAKQRLRTRSYSMVISDYRMPGDSGLDLLLYVSRVHPDLPFVMLTGHGDTSLACDVISAGASDFLAKPVDPRELGRLIQQNWARQDRDRQRAADLTNEVLTDAIRALVAAVDAKDPYTASHSERVTCLAMLLGEALNLPADRLQILWFAALMHDVGKIGVPESILQKPAKLDDQEWQVLRQHPARSAEIVARVGPLAEVATIVRHHHERVDGSGYPEGLQGDAIHPLARLMSITDAYEAMTSHRAYRPAMETDRARAQIAEGLGTHFDPMMGEVFLSMGDLP